MWLHCLCGVGNLGPFGGMASGLLAFHTHLCFIFLASPIRNMCALGLQLPALVMHSVIQLCCYFVVSSFVHSFYTYLQSVNNQLESARGDLAIAREIARQRKSEEVVTGQRTMEEMVKCLSKPGKKEIIVFPSELSEHITCLFPRKCYSKGLQYVAKKREENAQRKIFRFGGTPGVGKTTFRYWVLRRWLLGRMKGLPEFKHMLFSVGTEDLFLLSKDDDGAVSVTSPGTPNEVYPRLFTWSDTCLGVVEMSKPGGGIYDIPTEKCRMSLLMIVGSPGKFSKGAECFKGAVPLPFYFRVWKKREVSKLPTDLFTDAEEDEAEIRDRCVQYGGVLRLILMSYADAQGQVQEALRRLNINTIKQVVNDQTGEDSEKVHRLLKLNEDGEVESFISKHVARAAMQRLDGAAHEEMTQFMNTVANNPKGRAFYGYFFEERLGHDFSNGALYLVLGDGGSLTGPKNGLQHYQRKQETLKPDILYQPPACFQGIDFFILKSDDIYLLQTTVASNHTPADFTHNDHKELQRKLCKYYKLEKKKLNLHMIYVLPEENPTFAVPSSPTECSHTVAWPSVSVLRNSRKRRALPNSQESKNKKGKYTLV